MGRRGPINLVHDFRAVDTQRTFNFSVYCITDTHNGKQYIGMTKGDPEGRLHDHFYSDTKGSRFIRRAVSRKGAQHFESEILFATDSKSLALMAEVYFIWLHDTVRRREGGGYNTRIGGEYPGLRPEQSQRIRGVSYMLYDPDLVAPQDLDAIRLMQGKIMDELPELWRSLEEAMPCLQHAQYDEALDI